MFYLGYVTKIRKRGRTAHLPMSGGCSASCGCAAAAGEWFFPGKTGERCRDATLQHNL